MPLHERNHLSNKFLIFKDIFLNFSSTSTVLDFGGNRGNLLYFSKGEIPENLYTCIDVDVDALTCGNKEFPNANWLFYNKYNWMYNHKGVSSLDTIEISSFQDYIWAYSVFTHTDFVDLVDFIKWTLTLQFKKIAISILDINNDYIIDFFYNKRIDDYGYCIDLHDYKDKNIVYLLDNDRIIFDKEKLDKIDCTHIVTFYNISWLTEKLSFVNNIKIEYHPNNFSPFIVIEK